MDWVLVLNVLILLGVIGIGVISLTCTYLLIQRLRWLNSRVKTEAQNLYTQFQAYQELVRLIQPTKPLPLLRGWAASPDFLLHVAQYCVRARPKVIIECGAGASTLVLARCCEVNGQGHVYSLESGEGYAAQTRELLRDHGVEHNVTIIDAPLVPRAEVNGQRWYSTATLDVEPSSCELLIIDGPPMDTHVYARYPALPILLKWLSPKCVVFLDDSNRMPEKEILGRWKAEYADLAMFDLPAEKGCAKLVLSIPETQKPRYEA